MKLEEMGEHHMCLFMGMEETQLENHYGTTADEFLKWDIPAAVPYCEPMFKVSYDWLMPVVNKFTEMGSTITFGTHRIQWEYRYIYSPGSVGGGVAIRDEKPHVTLYNILLEMIYHWQKEKENATETDFAL